MNYLAAEQPDASQSALGFTRADALTAMRQRLRQGAPDAELVDMAIACRDRGMPDLASEFLTELIQHSPALSAAYYELAFIHRLNGEHLRAATLLAQSLRSAGDDSRTRIFLAHMLHALGAHGDADRVLDSTAPETDAEALDLVCLFELGAFLRDWPLGRTLFLLEQIKARRRYLTSHDVGVSLEQALRHHAPFALVRLGDGEGACLRLGAADEHAFARLYGRNRAEFSAMWFGPEFAFRDNGFLSLAQRLPTEIARCDVIGIPYASWIEHEYRICSLRGIPSLVNVLRSLDHGAALADAGRHVGLCPQHMHVDLHTDGVLEPILRRQRQVHVISCLDDLPALMQRRFGLDEVILHRIPGERGSASLLGERAITGTHYPEAFARLMQDLAQPQHGRLFLVAGGLLGKLYAATIRANGGVAVDIGSIVDAWSGRYTRPGYGAELSIC